MPETDTGGATRHLRGDVRDRLLARQPTPPGGVPSAPGEPVPVTRAQLAVALHERVKGGHAYQLPITIRLHGPLAADLLEEAITALVQRHAVLRTTVRYSGGGFVQDTAPAAPVGLARTTLTALPPKERSDALHELLAGEVTRGVDPARSPLLRAHLIALQPEEHVLLLLTHHLAADGASSDILLRDLGELYSAARAERSPMLPELPVSYQDFALWQRARTRSGAWDAQRSYWRERLRGAVPPAGLPYDRPRPPQVGPRGGTVPWHMPPGPAAGLRLLARERGTTFFAAVLAGYAALLHRLEAGDDLVVGVPFDGRRHPDLQPVAGLFATLLPLRLRAEPSMPFSALVDQAGDAVLGGLAHLDASAEPPDRDAAPPVRITLAMNPATPESEPFEHLRVERMHLPGASAKFDLGLALVDGPRIVGAFEYASDLWDRETVQGIGSALSAVLSSASGRPDTPVGSLPLVDGADREQVLRWSRAGAYE
ncbi:condensation domain-containing protein [Nocardiopsis sp. Huas11]|uniref:condensation domain-containing protein n=1 Tax=Nocardiopsis sp. Huas11 TaxID=2183912 RepID=UPI000EABC91F|nr:condensation domain-containing protein [Nocardiopsis sp. Huas11]RKS08428.1 condensation domain-containing protein [Nocardiopsis sp. Huas11]